MTMNQLNLIKVKMADMHTLSGPGLLRTSGLGSCVGVTIYDDQEQLAGMAHIMLPSSDIVRTSEFNHAKYADTAIIKLIDELVKLGADSKKLKAKLAGGAQMFNFTKGGLSIGTRNAEACKQMLQQNAIPIIAEDLGGNYGRTIEFNNSTGILYVRSVHYETKEL